jgi:hypothetical protein
MIKNKNFTYFEINPLDAKLKSLEAVFQKQPEGMTYLTMTLEFIKDSTLQHSVLDTVSLLLKGKSYTSFEEERKYLLNHFYTVTEYIISLNFNEDGTKQSIAAYFDILHYILLLILKKIRNDEITLQQEFNDDSVFVKLFKYFNRYINLLLTHIDDVFKRVKNKDYLQYVQHLNEQDFAKIKKPVMIDFEVFLDYIFLNCKYLIQPSNYETCKGLNVDFSTMLQNTTKLFGIAFQYVLINLKSYECEVHTKIRNCFTIENCLTFSYLLLDNVLSKKFTEDGDGYDYTTLMPCFNDFINFFYPFLRQQVLSKLTDFFSVVDNIDSFNFTKFDNYYIPPYLLVQHNDKLKEFINNHLVFIYLNENQHECVNRNFWLTILFDILGFGDFLEKLYRCIVEHFDSVENSMSKTSQTMINDFKSKVIVTTMNISCNKIAQKIFEIFNDYFTKKYQIKLPKKFLFFKEVYTVIYLYIFNYYVTFSQRLKAYIESNKNIKYKYSNLVQVLEHISLNYNKRCFLLSNNILNILQGDDYRKRIRIYIQEDSLLEYVNLIHENSYDLDIQLGCNGINKENSDNNIEPILTKGTSMAKRRRAKTFRFNITGLNILSQIINSDKNFRITYCKKSNKTYLRINQINTSMIIGQNANGYIYFEEPKVKYLKEIQYNDTIDKFDIEFLTTNNPEDFEQFGNNLKDSLKYYDLENNIDYDIMKSNINSFLDFK